MCTAPAVGRTGINLYEPISLPAVDAHVEVCCSTLIRVLESFAAVFLGHSRYQQPEAFYQASRNGPLCLVQVLPVPEELREWRRPFEGGESGAC